ncbi:MAG: CYTH domain-containing protein [Thiotrichales bacterium]|nr:MAG: CYTH domain-containing protein [Thiotrichales bacterium]
MTSQSREIEFKFGVADAKAFDHLLQGLDLPGSLLDQGKIQTNHFFDSPSLCLHEQGFVIRLRQQDGIGILTVKGEQQAEATGSGVLSSRFEEEVTLPAQAADDMLQGILPPQQVIEAHFGRRSTAVLQLINRACGDQDLVHIGEFRNVRIHLPVIQFPVGENLEPIEFELDSSTFPDGRIDHEIEIEIAAHSDANGIEAALIALFKRCGIDWHTAPSKAKRFFKALTD